VRTVLSPVVMTYFLVFATGARLLEKEMATRPGYPAYQRRTSYPLPRPREGGLGVTPSGARSGRRRAARDDTRHRPR
jgi:hypothetical protein